MRCQGSQRHGKTCGRMSDTPAGIDYEGKIAFSHIHMYMYVYKYMY